jgi:hypothetical protein
MRRCRAAGRLILAIAAIAALAGPGHTSGKASFSIKPPPSWVLPPPALSASVPQDANGGIFHFLEDYQRRVSGNSTERYSHRVLKILSARGLETASQIKLEFEPSYEDLVIHHISIRRGDRTINALKPAEIRLVQQQTDLDEREYNGQFSALLFLNDVRLGDVLDYAYSINGDNPVFKGRSADIAYLAGASPVQKLRWRLLWPSGRSLHFRSLNTDLKPVTRDLAGNQEYTWELENVPALDPDDKTPTWFDPMPQVQLAEFSGWEDVVNWAAPLYKPVLPVPAELENQILAWRRESDRPEDQIQAALRFVQDEVRYLAIEIGPYSHQPSPPARVFKRRFGDCKDKSLLLATILSEIGIEAYPALVNTDAEQALSDFQPSPFDFDHCIVKAQAGGNSYWLDPTITLQRGPVSTASTLKYARALVLKEGTRDLETIPPPPADLLMVSVDQVYTVESHSAAASLSVKTTFRGSEADSMRHSLAGHPISDLAKDFLNYYADTDASISADGLPTVSDDPVSNTIVTVERYRIPDFWNGEGRYVFADRINEELARPSISQRSMPLAISYPAYVSQSIEVHLPESVQISPGSATFSDEAVRFEYKIGAAGNTANLSFIYRTLQDHVDPARVANHLDTIERIRKVLSQRVSARGSAGVGLQQPGDSLSVLLGLGILGAFIVVIVLVVRAVHSRVAQASGGRFRQFRQGLEMREGDGPARPIPVPSEEGIRGKLQSMRCPSCGSRYPDEESKLHREGLMFDGRRVIAIGLKCERCRRERDVYFAPSAEMGT